jgi:hypothetical protein
LALKHLTLKLKPALIKSEYLDAKYSTDIFHVYTLSRTFMCCCTYKRIRRHIFMEEKNILLEAGRDVVQSPVVFKTYTSFPVRN